MQWWTRRFNRRLAGALGIVLFVLFADSIVKAPVMLLFVSIFWVYSVAVALSIEWLILWRTRKAVAPELPLGPARWTGQRRLKYALIALVAFITLAREGAFDPLFVFSISRYQFAFADHHQSDQSASSQGNVRFAGRAVHCMISCMGARDVCSGFLRALGCPADLNTERGYADSDLQLSGTMHFSGTPFCFTPLYKSAEATYDGQFKLFADSASGHKSDLLSTSGKATGELTGIASCRQFQGLLGSDVGNVLATQINQIIQSN